MHSLIPKPASITPISGTFALSNTTKIVPAKPDVELSALAAQLSEFIQHHLYLQVEVSPSASDTGNIHVALWDDQTFGDEGYELSITAEGIQLTAQHYAGLFYGIQTLEQLISTHRTTRELPALSIMDSPRFPWRGAMLDVARHFFSVEDVKRYIDLISHYKMNRLHLHLTDDQGWRIEIKSWPKLTEIGGRTQVDGGGGGFYTQEQFKEIVDYAKSRYVMIIPEVDTPGHTNAALASYPQLNSTEEAPQLYEGTKVGFSSLWIRSEITYQFLDDVVRELAEISPAPYIHIGGDEAHSTPAEDYKYYIKRIQQIVQSHGKQTIGWAEIGDAEVLPGTIAQHWVNTGYQGAKAQGAKIILSPANKTYVDMKYDASSPLGLDWVGFISVKDAYDWEPASYMHLLEESDILGIEAPLWSETLKNIKDVEFLAFPRIAGLAELAWSPKGQTWEEYKVRLAKHGKHMEALNINFFKSPDVAWE